MTFCQSLFWLIILLRDSKSHSEGFDYKIPDDKHAEGDAVYAKRGEAVTLDEIHKKFDYRKGDKVRDGNADEQKPYLRRGGGVALKNKLRYLQKRRAEHNRNSHKEGELRACGARDAREHSAENGRA